MISPVPHVSLREREREGERLILGAKIFYYHPDVPEGRELHMNFHF
jgi:hypothetical protein